MQRYVWIQMYNNNRAGAFYFRYNHIQSNAFLLSYVTLYIAFLLFHNIVYGLSAGLLFLPPMKECHKFFPKLKLVTNSIILTGTGLGAVLFGAYNIECIENKQ